MRPILCTAVSDVFLAEQGIEAVVGIRGAARLLVDEAMRAGMSGDAAYFFFNSGRSR